MRRGMFIQLKRLNNEKGIVLFVVIMTIIIMMIIGASILSQSANEIFFAQQQIDEITSDQLAKGVFWSQYSSGVFPATPTTITCSLNNRTYTVTLTNLGFAGGVTNYSVVANYDSFS